MQVVSDITETHFAEGWEPQVVLGSSEASSSCAIVPCEERALVPAESKPKIRYGVREGWQEVAREAMPSSIVRTSGQIRESGRKWLQQHSLSTKAFKTSSLNKQTALIAQCDACTSCTKAWCFSFRVSGSATVFVIEEKGSCGGERNTKRLKREHAKKYASQGSASMALVAMRAAGAPDAELPEMFHAVFLWLEFVLLQLLMPDVVSDVPNHKLLFQL